MDSHWGVLDSLGPRPAAALAAVGLATAALTLFKAVNFSLVYLRPSTIRRYLHKSPEGEVSWALITGASDGIGKALARELAGHGFNVVLHGRNPAKLDKVIQALEQDFPERSFRTVIADAARVPCASCVHDVSGDQADHERLDVDALVQTVSDLPITVLISNVGAAAFLGDNVYRTLDCCSTPSLISNVATNVLFPTLVLARLIPILSRNAPALVINVSSLSDNGLPLIACYASGKTFGSMITRTAGRELLMESRGVDVLDLRVGHVTGVQHEKVPATFFLPDATTFAKSALARVGCGRDSVIPYFPHALQQFAVSFFPGWVLDRMFVQIMRDLRDKEAKELKAQ